jgi:tRNA A37 methylthiotransferase MiaB
MQKQKVFIYESWTCNRRKLDANRFRDYFLKNGYQIVTNPKDAQLIILITCAYTKRHAERSLELTKRFQKYDAELIVTGCLPKIETKALQNIFSGKMISTEELDQFDRLFPGNKIKFADINDGNSLWENANEYSTLRATRQLFESTPLMGRLQKKIGTQILGRVFEKESSNCLRSTRSYISMMYIRERWNPNLKLHKDSFFIRPAWGCQWNCSYCIIKKAIGPLKSKPVETVVNEFKIGLNQHYKNFIFDADDIGAYGTDIQTNLPDLLNSITDIPGEYTIHIRNIHPAWIVTYKDQLSNVLKKGKIRGIGSSIQSGNKRILTLMKRYPEMDRIKNAYASLRESYPNLLLATECINGFPTESQEEFTETLQSIKDTNFHLGYIYSFSCRPGTVAENLTPKVTAKEISDRMRYAKTYLERTGYHCALFKHQGLLIFSLPSLDIINDEDARSFCLATFN